MYNGKQSTKKKKKKTLILATKHAQNIKELQNKPKQTCYNINKERNKIKTWKEKQKNEKKGLKPNT